MRVPKPKCSICKRREFPVVIVQMNWFSEKTVCIDCLLNGKVLA